MSINQRDRLNFQLAQMADLAGLIAFNIECIIQDNADSSSDVYDVLYAGILSDALQEVEAVGNLLHYVLENPKPQTGYDISKALNDASN